MVTLFCGLASLSGSAIALEPVSVSRDDKALDITEAVELYTENTDSLKISTAPGADGIVRRIEVRAKEPDTGGASNWAVFALANNTNEQLDRLIVAPHYRLVDSSLFPPELDSVRIAAITPSEGFSLERVNDSEADVFLITLDPGAVITLIAEQKTKKLPKLFLWEPDRYKDTVNSYTLYRGIVLGISGLLAVFLTILFVVKGSAIFPATAALAWGVLAFICVDFGFWTKVVGITTGTEPVWRAGAEVFLAVSLIIFLYTYLNLSRWHEHFSTVAIAWVLGLIILLGVAIVEPNIAAGIARFSFALTAICGAALILFMSAKRFDRAVMLIPTWVLIIAWTLAAAMTASGGISNDIVQPALGGGLVLIVMLLGFTVMQHAFAGGALAQGLVSDVERQALALIGSGDIVWDWDVTRDQFHTGEEAASILGVDEKLMNSDTVSWTGLLHPNDRDRFQATLDAILEHKRGRISQAFRLRSSEGHYHWFKMRARPMLGSDGHVIRCIGTIADVTEQKNSEERILYDAVHDNLTGLENRELFVKRLETAITISQTNTAIRPSVFHINIDHFRDINSRLGFSVGDTILLTAARRLGRVLKSGDSMARLGGDQFALLLLSETLPENIATFADSLRRSLRAPIQFGDNEIRMTASIGISSWTADHGDPTQMLRDAELAMLQAKRFGGDRIEPYRPAFSTTRDDTTLLLDDLKRAMNMGDIRLVYQPIVDITTRRIVGFEALTRWNHARLGTIPPSEFVPLAERSGLINQLGNLVLETAATDFASMAHELGTQDVFVSVNLSSRELLRHDIVHDISATLEKTQLPVHMLRLEVTENLVMHNPEHSSQVLERIRNLGVGLSLDDFGTGYSSLSYLLRYPFDTIKIDRSFLQSKAYKERTIVLRSILGMASGLNQKVIAEGVESESDVAELLQLHCTMGQGYIFGEPMPIEHAKAMMADDLEHAAAT